jgi:hypothetical protein
MDGNTRIVGKGLMPRPWFSANTISSTMAFIMPDKNAGQERSIPLGDGERELGWFILPPFQRPPVWTEAQKIRFIESAWSGLPLGVFVFNRPEHHNHPYENYLLDGQQRIGAVIDYVTDMFPVFGHKFSDLHDQDMRRWHMAVGFTCLQTRLTDLGEIREVYDRLAYGGTAHEPKALTLP